MSNKFDELTKSISQSVTRRGALKKFGSFLGGTALAGLLALAFSAHADLPGNPDTQRIAFNRSLGGYVVTGGANPNFDPRNLQWALDHSDGGSVFLRQTLDLGTRTVFITTNVRLTAAPGASPVIKNGGDPNAGHDSPNQSAIYVGWNGQALLSAPARGQYGVQEHPRFPGVVQYFPAFPVQFAIQGLHFQDCARAAIIIGACTGATIEGNTFTNMKWALYDQWYVSGPQFRSRAVALSGALYAPYLGLISASMLDAASLQSGSRAVSGSVKIRNNIIDLVGRSDGPDGFDPDLAEGIGISAAFTSADLVIESNQVSHVALGSGINIIGNLGAGSVVSGNRISDTDFYGIRGWAYLFPCTFTVVGNQLEVGGPDSQVDGIALEGDTYDPQSDSSYVQSDATVLRSQICGNTIAVNGLAYGAVTLYNHCVQTTVTGNTIQGSAAWAVGSIIYEDTESADQNTVANNGIAPSFQADVANIFLMPGVGRCIITRNAIGGGGTAGVLCQGARNLIAANDYSLSGYPGFAQGAGCVLLDEGSAGNIVAETRFPAGTDICSQVQNLGVNTVLGAGGCK